MKHRIAKFNLLLFSLEKKREHLRIILEETVKEPSDLQEFRQTLEIKQRRMEEIHKLDRGFQHLYEEVAPYLEEKKEENATTIRQMQDCIREIEGLMQKITESEKKRYNDLRIKAAEGSKISKSARLSKAQASKQYRKQKREE